MTLFFSLGPRERHGYNIPTQESSTSPYRESSKSSFRQQPQPPPPDPPSYRPPDPQPPTPGSYSYKGQRSVDSSSSSSGRYQRDRVNSMDKSNPPYFPPRGGPGKQQSIDGGSIGRRHAGGSVSLSDASVREVYGAIMAERNEGKNSTPRSGQNEMAKQRSFHAIAERESTGRDKEFRRAATCNNSMDSEYTLTILINSVSSKNHCFLSNNSKFT